MSKNYSALSTQHSVLSTLKAVATVINFDKRQFLTQVKNPVLAKVILK
ncbi:hypothetical protein [Aulosira sp. FACHB-615]|nr:hypothetical protein [Aulosira sp. FACHB-615]MBD2486018.1 hypothetical protein [Aulosira sp. FACHB-615]